MSPNRASAPTGPRPSAAAAHGWHAASARRDAARAAPRSARTPRGALRGGWTVGDGSSAPRGQSRSGGGRGGRCGAKGGRSVDSVDLQTWEVAKLADDVLMNAETAAVSKVTIIRAGPGLRCCDRGIPLRNPCAVGAVRPSVSPIAAARTVVLCVPSPRSRRPERECPATASTSPRFSQFIAGPGPAPQAW